MQPDTLSVIFRSASFIALFQAAGMAIFLALFGRPLEVSRSPIELAAKLSAVAAAVLVVGQYTLEAARMAGDMSGITDPSLQMMVMHSASSLVLGVRLMGLLAIVIGLGRGKGRGALGVIGAGMIAVSFMLIGHSAANPQRWVLAPLLAIHVMIVAFWFGALLPLCLACTRETPLIAGRVTEAFSNMALWLVPGIFAAGALIGCILVRHLAEFRSGYGLSLLAKFAGFVLLMGIAAVNKWRLGPAIARGNAQVLTAFRLSLGIEYLLICVVLGITAAMTTLYSPES
ncbi:MAG TPA: CopD family protein [Steroidobacteraceae bacterium]|nr:CopD family protein [Steroidobacteraceae bacterium]